MAYAAQKFGVSLFRVKISFTNGPSLGLFAALGYSEVSRSEIFEEVTLELNAATSERLSEIGSNLKVTDCL